MLRFENHRRIEGADYRNDAVWSSPWLAASFFTEREVEQLKVILAEWALDPDGAFSMPCSAFNGMAEIPLDRWDVSDPDGKKLYTVWEYMTDHGMVFRYGTAEVIGSVGDFEDAYEDLARGLEMALRRAAEADPDAELPSNGFAELDDD